MAAELHRPWAAEKQLHENSGSFSGDWEIEKKLESCMQHLRPAVDSPKSLLIVRNAALTMLEVEGKAEVQSVFLLVRDKDYRQSVVDKLAAGTPNYWDEVWNHAWTKEVDPLYSSEQQGIARRRSLISFWRSEWDTLPEDEVSQIVKNLQQLV